MEKMTHESDKMMTMANGKNGKRKREKLVKIANNLWGDRDFSHKL